MAVRPKWISGAYCLMDNYNHRMIDAWGQNVHKFVTDFTSMPVDDTTGDPTEWTDTIVELGTGDSTATISDAQGGWLRINAAANENDGYTMQLKGETFKPSSGGYIYFSTKIKADEATQSDIFIGLAVTDTSPTAAVADGIYFRKIDGATAMYFVTENTNTETATSALTFAAATEYVLEFVVDGTGTAYGYVNGSLVATHTANIPTTELRITIEYLNGAGTMQNKGMDVDYIRCFGIMNS